MACCMLGATHTHTYMTLCLDRDGRESRAGVARGLTMPMKWPLWTEQKWGARERLGCWSLVGIILKNWREEKNGIPKELAKLMFFPPVRP
eukprot:scaffold6792_cov35-Tisochrysis_lutea.AAC.4